MSTSLRTLRIQTALFLSTIDLTDRLTLATAMRAASHGILDGEPVMLPVPPNAPAEIPRLRLGQAGDGWGCQVSPQRVDFFFERSLKQAHEEEPPDAVELHFKLTQNVWSQLEEQFRATANRIGLIVRFGTRLSHATRLVCQSFLRTDSFDSSEKIEVHALRKIRMGTYDVNRWARLRAVGLESDDNAQGSLLLDIDINTLPTQQLDLLSEDIAQFLAQAFALSQDTMEDLAGQLPEE